MPPVSVACPAESDHETTIKTITVKINNLKGTLTTRYQEEKIALQQTLQMAKQYNTTFGDVYATSGIRRMLLNCKGRSDWAIISITNPDVIVENKVCILSMVVDIS